MFSRRTAIAAIAAPLVIRSEAASAPALIDVFAAPGATTGLLRLCELSFPCVLGRSGISPAKHEGDGATPSGQFPVREVRYRPDRLPRKPGTGLPVIATRQSDGWCDDPADSRYNRPVQLPYPRSAEAMWRDDHLYDVLAVIGYNDTPPVPGNGSAIFLHVMRPDGHPTSGCVALAQDELLAVLARCETGTTIRIQSV